MGLNIHEGHHVYAYAVESPTKCTLCCSSWLQFFKALLNLPSPLSRSSSCDLGQVLWNSSSEFADIVLICKGGTIEAHKSVLVATCELFRAKVSASTTKLKFAFEATKDDLLRVLEFVYCNKVLVDSKDKERISGLARTLGVRGWPHLSSSADSSPEEMETDQHQEDGAEKLNLDQVSEACSSSTEAPQVPVVDSRNDDSARKRELLVEVEEKRSLPTKRVRFSDEESNSSLVLSGGSEMNLDLVSEACPSSTEAPQAPVADSRNDDSARKKGILVKVEEQRSLTKKVVRFVLPDRSARGLPSAQAAGLTLDQFPDELLVLIFSFVSTHDLLRNVATVCSRFERITRDPGAHVRVSIPFDIDMRGAAMFLLQMDKIESLEIFTPKDQIHLQSAQGLTNSSKSLGDKRFRRCDSLILSISNHPKVKSVIVEGMRLTADTFAFLGTTSFFNNLEVLGICLDQSYGHRRTAVDCTATGIRKLASVGKLTHLRLKGIEDLRPDLIVDLARACPNLQMLETDAALKKDSVNAILKERFETMEYLKGRKPLHLCGDDNRLVLSRCTKMKSLVDFGIPFFEGLFDKPDLKSLFITVTQRREMELMQKAFRTGITSNVTSLNLYITKHEVEIYPFLSVGFPNLRKLLLYVHNSRDTPGLFTKAILGLDKLTIFGIQPKAGAVLNFDISEVFIKGTCKNLKMVYFDVGSNSRLQAKRLFRKLPRLELVVTKTRCFVKPDSTFKSVMRHIRSMNDEQMTIVVLDDVYDDAVNYNNLI